MFHRILYVSQANKSQELSLQELSASAENQNRKFSITGYMYFNGEFFIQYLEGPRSALDQLMTNIRADARHSILYEKPLPPQSLRMFNDWFMRDLTQESFHDKSLKNLLDRGINRLSRPATSENAFSLSFAESHIHNVARFKDSNSMAS